MLVRPDILKDFACDGNRRTVSHTSFAAIVSENGNGNLRILLLEIVFGVKSIQA